MQKSTPIGKGEGKMGRNKRKIVLDDSQDILVSTQEEIATMTANRLAVFIVRTVIFGENQRLGIIKELTDFPTWLNQADEITVSIVYADQKEPVTVSLFYQ